MYRTTQTSNLDGSSVRSISGIPDILTRYGIKIPTDVVKATERHARILEHIATIAGTSDTDNAHDVAARALANGEGTIEQLTLAAATRVITTKDPNSPFRKIIGRARDLAAKDLQAAYAEHGDEWVTLLRPAIEDAAATLAAHTEYAPQYDAFLDRNAADHWLKNPAIHDAWQKLRDLYQVARTLRRYRITTGGGHRDDHYEWTGNADHTWKKAGDVLEGSIRDNLVDGNLTWYLMATQAGMRPTLLASTDVMANA